MNCSVVVPVYNSERILPHLVERLERQLSSSMAEYEIILVNDGSRDGSWEVIRALAAASPRIVPIDLMRNYGQHNALLCGIRAARHEVIVTIDDDLQQPPEEIPRLIAKLEEGYDAVYGVPEHERHSPWRNVASQITKVVLQRSMGAKIARKVSAFRAFRTGVRDAFESFQGSLLSIDVLLTWGTTRFAAVTVSRQERFEGESNYTFRMLLVHALNMMTGFSTVPLKLASWIGFGFTLFGLLVLAFVVIRYLIEGTPQPGFPFLASIIAIFSGVQLFCLGIIGEYIARIHLRSMEKPPYVRRNPPFPPGGAGPPRKEP